MFLASIASRLIVTRQDENHFEVISMGMLIGRVIATALMVSVLMSCASVGDIRGVRDTGPSIFVTGSLERVKEAAVIALAGVRLGSPQIEPFENGYVIYAEQSTMAAMVFNSYGGFGKVTIVGGKPNSKNVYSVSAITRSRIANEPVGAQDVLKGYNYNDSRVALTILDRLSENLKEKEHK